MSTMGIALSLYFASCHQPSEVKGSLVQEVRSAAGMYSVENLARTTLSDFIESRIDKVMSHSPYGTTADKVFVRVLSSKREIFTLDRGLQAFVRQFGIAGRFPYMTKAIFCFQRCDKSDKEKCLMFFGLFVQEYDRNCPPPNQNSIYIAMLDSCRLFQPAPLRKVVHQMVLLSYLEFMNHRGFEAAFLWSCPPQKTDEYIFRHRPAFEVSKSEIAKKINLNKWYASLMKLGKTLNVISDFGPLYDWCPNNAQDFFMKFPYFRDDHWPGTIEEIIDNCVQERAVAAMKPPRKKAKIQIQPESLVELVFKNTQVKLKGLRESFYRMSLVAQNGVQHQDEGEFMLPSKLACSRDKLVDFFKQQNLEFIDNRSAVYSTTSFITKTCMDCAVFYCSSCKLAIEKGFLCKVCNLNYCINCCTNKCKKGHQNANFIDIICPVVQQRN